MFIFFKRSCSLKLQLSLYFVAKLCPTKYYIRRKKETWRARERERERERDDNGVRQG